MQNGAAMACSRLTTVIPARGAGRWEAWLEYRESWIIGPVSRWIKEGAVESLMAVRCGAISYAIKKKK